MDLFFKVIFCIGCFTVGFITTTQALAPAVSDTKNRQNIIGFTLGTVLMLMGAYGLRS